MADQRFSLAKPFGQWMVHVAFIPHAGIDMDATVNVGLRIEAVHKVIQEHALLLHGPPPPWVLELPKGFVRNGATISANLGNISGVGYSNWKMTSKDQSGAIAASMYSDIKAIGFPYFERYSNMECVLRLLTGPRSRDTSALLPDRCIQAVALAFVLGDPSTIEAVVQSCKTLLSGPDCERDRARIANFVDALRLKLKNGELPKLET